jgi:hypothetical protein
MARNKPIKTKRNPRLPLRGTCLRRGRDRQASGQAESRVFPLVTRSISGWGRKRRFASKSVGSGFSRWWILIRGRREPELRRHGRGGGWGKNIDWELFKRWKSNRNPSITAQMARDFLPFIKNHYDLITTFRNPGRSSYLHI